LYVAKASKDGLNAGFKQENEFLKSANLNLSGTSQGDGAGGRQSLAGYVITKSNRAIAFAAYVNHTSLPNDPDAAQNVAGQALGEIAAARCDRLR
jgi:hypothetical protein